MTYLALIAISIGIGMLVGSVGIGGILLAPALALFAGMTIHQSMATALCTFIFTGLVGTLYFQRKGSIDWALAKPVCGGAVIASFAGAWLNSRLSTSTLSLLLSVIIIFAGAYTLGSDRTVPITLFEDDPRSQKYLLIGIGVAAGFASGLTGIGGPVLAVPLMVLCGFPILASIGVSQVLQIAGALSGTIANARFGTIDFGFAAFITIFEIIGVLAGAYVVHRVDVRVIKRFVGMLCLVAGSLFLYKNLMN